MVTMARRGKEAPSEDLIRLAGVVTGECELGANLDWLNRVTCPNRAFSF